MVGSCPAEVVRHTGGWLFDRVTAGWEALVLLADGSDERPLRILGADVGAGLSWSIRVLKPQAIAVAADLYASDERARRIVLDAVRSGVEEIRMWGDCWPSDLKGGQSVQHRLSVAARAFKAQAMAAAASPVETLDGTETFLDGAQPLPNLVSAS